MRINPGVVFIILFLLGIMAYKDDPYQLTFAIIYGALGAVLSFPDYVQEEKR